MLWKIIVSLLAFFHPNRHHNDVAWNATDIGPISEADILQAHEALHNDDLFGGDMIIDGDIADAGARDTKLRWPGYPGKGVVPYVIHSSLAKHKAMILRSMEQYHTQTCIRFVPRKNEKNYILLIKKPGCSSHVGLANRGAQELKLGDGCHYVGTIVHELGHAIGLYHEHQRSDRDQYVKINQSNIKPALRHNFDKTDKNKEVITTSYDYNSIMHYGNFAFSKRPNKLKTMEAKNGQQLLDPYKKQGFTNTDIQMIKQLYQC